jgi:hypothetical protein
VGQFITKIAQVPVDPLADPESDGADEAFDSFIQVLNGDGPAADDLDHVSFEDEDG